LEAPLKITSSIFELLNLLVFCSPKTHLIASTIFVLPQPLGPTIPVIPELNKTVSFFAKDLKPQKFLILKYAFFYPGGHPKDLPPMKCR
tara:strand:- start:54 stop:320 length:267 start_codon:yes stop_codon:yes gene_type:complete